MAKLSSTEIYGDLHVDGDITTTNINVSKITGISGAALTDVSLPNTEDCSFKFYSHIDRAAAGLFPTANNANAMISINKHDGHYDSQLGFNSDGGIYYRSVSAAEMSPSTAWRQLAFTDSDITGNAASANWANAAKFLDIRGTNTITSPANDTTSAWATQGNSVHWYTATGQLIDQPGQWGLLLNTVAGGDVHQIWMTQASGNLLHRGGNASGWNGSWRVLMDSVNYSNHALPLSGGTLNGTLNMNSNIAFADVNSTTYPAQSSGISWSGSTDGASIYYRVDTGDAGRLVINLTDDSNARLDFAANGTTKSYIDTNGNFSGSSSRWGGYNIWVGNQADYDAIATKSNSTLYYIM